MRGRQHDYDDHYKALVQQLYIANPHFRWISKMCEYGYSSTATSRLRKGRVETVSKRKLRRGTCDEVERSHPGGLTTCIINI